MSKRYVPNLIPEEHKILKNYFKGSIYTRSKLNELHIIMSWFFGITSFFTALVWIAHPLLFVVFCFLGYALIPPGQKFLEKKLRFRFTTRIKTLFSVALIIFAVPFIIYYGAVDKERGLQEQKEKLIAEQEAKKQQDSINQSIKQKKDSLDFFIHKSNALRDKLQFDDAFKQLSLANNFINDSIDSNRLIEETAITHSARVSALIQSGKYKEAIPELTDLISNNSTNGNLVYHRALCYSKAGNIEQAVADCKVAMDLHYPDAEKLHDKINPVRRKIVGYETLCCDGTTSNARGRGACSHHDGVCDWNSPVYEESRKY